ncbi:MAG TPA: phosphate signaling complex protein PhoU [Myxococcota bacterium]|jgi:phosphate transport system protein
MTRPVDPALTALRDQLLRMGSFSEAILEKSLQSLWRRDLALAREVKIDDLEIDRLDIAVDDMVLRILATQAPVADDLRNVIAGKMIATDLERIGDLARNIAKSAERLATRASIETPPKLRTLADEAQRILRRALDAFVESDAKRAAAVLDDDDQVDADEDAVIRTAIEEIASRPEFTAQEVDFILIAKNLERVADHATNIAEDVILATQARNVKHASKLSV